MTDPEIDEGIIDYLDREEWEYNRLWETDGQCLWDTFQSIADELERRENEYAAKKICMGDREPQKEFIYRNGRSKIMGSIIAFPEPPEHPRFIEKNDGWYFVENDRYEDKIENLLAGRCETNLGELEAQDMIHCAAAAYLKKANMEAAGIVRGRADCLRKALDWLALLG